MRRQVPAVASRSVATVGMPFLKRLASKLWEGLSPSLSSLSK